MVDWALLGSGECNKGWDFGSFTAACLQTHLASKQEKRVLIILIIKHTGQVQTQ